VKTSREYQISEAVFLQFLPNGSLKHSCHFHEIAMRWIRLLALVTAVTLAQPSGDDGGGQGGEGEGNGGGEGQGGQQGGQQKPWEVSW